MLLLTGSVTEKMYNEVFKCYKNCQLDKQWNKLTLLQSKNAERFLEAFHMDEQIIEQYLDDFQAVNSIILFEGLEPRPTTLIHDLKVLNCLLEKLGSKNVNPCSIYIYFYMISNEHLSFHTLTSELLKSTELFKQLKLENEEQQIQYLKTKCKLWDRSVFEELITTLQPPENVCEKPKLRNLSRFENEPLLKTSNDTSSTLQSYNSLDKNVNVMKILNDKRRRFLSQFKSRFNVRNFIGNHFDKSDPKSLYIIGCEHQDAFQIFKQIKYDTNQQNAVKITDEVYNLDYLDKFAENKQDKIYSSPSLSFSENELKNVKAILLVVKFNVNQAWSSFADIENILSNCDDSVIELLIIICIQTGNIKLSDDEFENTFYKSECYSFFEKKGYQKIQYVLWDTEGPYYSTQESKLSKALETLPNQKE